MKTFASMFSGCGGSEQGAVWAGYAPIWGIECENKISDVYELNFGKHIIRDYVQNVDVRPLETPDMFWTSPVCTRVSKAHSKGVETQLDIECAEVVANFLRVKKPDRFVLENVEEYAKTDSMEIIRSAMDDVYGWFHEDLVYVTNCEIPQQRKRFIVRSSAYHINPYIKKVNHNGWLNSVVDIIDTLPDSTFPSWIEEGIVGLKEPIYLVDGKPKNYKGEICIKLPKDPCPTITASIAKHPFRFNINGKIKGMNTRLLARLHGFPDSFKFSGKNSTDWLVIGNAVAPPMSQLIIESFE